MNKQQVKRYLLLLWVPMFASMMFMIYFMATQQVLYGKSAALLVIVQALSMLPLTKKVAALRRLEVQATSKDSGTEPHD